MAIVSKLTRCALIAGLAAGLFAGTASAGVLHNDISRGGYIETGFFGTGGSGTPSGNYLTGTDAGDEFRSFFVFDLSGFDWTSIGGFLGGASLRINLASGGNVARGSGGTPTATLGIFDYTGDIAALTAGGAGLTGYNDLGSGLEYGSAIVSTSDVDPSEVVITLDADALAAITAAAQAGSDIAFGGALTDIADPEHFLFANSLDAPPVVLDLLIAIPEPVPEPATLALFGGALIGLSWLRRRKA